MLELHNPAWGTGGTGPSTLTENNTVNFTVHVKSLQT